MLANQHPETHKVFTARAQRFNRDFRFKILSLRFIADPVQRSNAMLELVSELSATDYIDNSNPVMMFTATLVAELNREAAFLKTAEEFIKVYPNSYELKLLLADRYEKAGKDAEACKLYTEILKAKDLVTNSGKLLAATDRSFLASWVETLEARLKY
ncbi:MAG: hypothetical protein R3A13_03060 [Bdellovibrionota bacterium]